MWLLGTPPTPLDDGAVFTRWRDLGLEGKDRRLCWCEWSAPRGSDLDDREAWAAANPALGYRIGYEGVADERAAMSDDGFARERLGLWAADSVSRVIDAESWGRQADPASMAVDKLTLAIDVSPDRSVAAVSLAGQRPDGTWHVELDDHRKGADWVTGWVKQRATKNRLHAVVVDELAGLTEQRNGRHYLKGTMIQVTLASSEGRDMAIACAGYFDGIMSGTVWHTDQPQVNLALSQAGKRPVGSGWAWNKKTAESDITPTVSQTLALWGAQNSTVKRPGGRDSGGGRRGVIL
jgi:hypothetical protein